MGFGPCAFKIMFYKIYRYIYLNVYTLMLDVCCFILLALIIYCFIISNFILTAICVPFFLYLINIIARLHRSTREKYFSLEKLNSHNNAFLDSSSYEKYMNAPCTRRIVRLSLNEIGRPEQYKRIRDQYQKHFFVKRNDSQFKITINNTENT